MFQIQNILEQVLKENSEQDCRAACACQRLERILTERQFKDRLYKERMRSERTKSPMTVVFVNVSRVTEVKKRKRSPDSDVNNLLRTFIDSCTRETDFLGWYECNRILGIVYIDTVQSDSRNFLMEKVKKSLGEFQSGQINSEIDVAAVTFPLKDMRDTDSIAFTVYPSKKDTFSEKLFLSIKRMFDIVGGIGGLLFFFTTFLPHSAFN